MVHDFIHFGSLAREEFLKHNPAGEAERQAEKVYAPPVVDVLGGKSTARDMAILTLQTRDRGEPMNFHLAADASALRKLIGAAQARFGALEGRVRPLQGHH